MLTLLAPPLELELRVTMLKSEFAVTQPWTTDTRGPLRWVFSHVRRNWPLVLLILAGAIGNAGLAAAIPILTGQAFDAITGANPNLQVLLTASLLLIVSQAVRSALQLGAQLSAARCWANVWNGTPARNSTARCSARAWASTTCVRPVKSWRAPPTTCANWP